MYWIETEIEIAASPQRIWSILMDFSAYPEWNPFIRTLSGDVTPGRSLRASIQLPGAKAMSFRPKVRVAEHLKELRWLGHLLLPGLFDGEHYFQLAALANGHTRFVQGEKFSGMLMSLFAARLGVSIKEGFVAMNAALKDRAEREAGDGSMHQEISG